MPTRDRKAYILLHNKAIKKENEEYDRMSNSSNNGRGSITGDNIDAYTDMSQGNRMD